MGKAETKPLTLWDLWIPGGSRVDSVDVADRVPLCNGSEELNEGVTSRAARPVVIDIGDGQTATRKKNLRQIFAPAECVAAGTVRYEVRRCLFPTLFLLLVSFSPIAFPMASADVFQRHRNGRIKEQRRSEATRVPKAGMVGR